MIIGVPKEIKSDERRVAITPSGVNAFVMRGHKVLIEKSAGVGSGIEDYQYRDAGAEILSEPQEVWGRAEMILKIKEPVEPEIDRMREGQMIFTYLHLAANRDLAMAMLDRGVIGIAYETIQLPDKSLPLLTPMSEVAGRLAIQMGAYCLEVRNGGSGILISGVSGVRPAKVVIVGGGTAGFNACQLAVGIGAQVSILDINPARMGYIKDIMGGHVTTIMSNSANIAEEVLSADLVVGAVLIPGAKAPRLITEEMVKKMKRGSAIVDISVDQGGCCETTKPTTHAHPTYITHGVVHYCVTNMPGIVPRTSTYALTNVTLSYALELADKGFRKAMSENPALLKGLNVYNGNVTHPAVAESIGMEFVPFLP